MLYLAPYIGTGTRDDAFRPRGAESGFSSVDLRPDPTKVDGYALLYMPGGSSEPGLEKLGEHKHEVCSVIAGIRAGNKLGKSFDHKNKTVGDLVGDLLMSPPSVRGWKPLQHAMRLGQPGRYYEVLLNNERFFELPVLAGMTVRTDDFNRADENPIGGNWTNTQSGTGRAQIISNQLTSSGDLGQNDHACYWNADTFSNDQFSSAQFVAQGGGSCAPGLTVRGSGIASDFYCCQLFSGSDLFKYVAGSYTSLSRPADTWTANDYMRLQVSGTSLGFYHDTLTIPTTLIASATDSAFASGKVGVYNWLGQGIWDNWRGGDLADLNGTSYTSYYDSRMKRTHDAIAKRKRHRK